MGQSLVSTEPENRTAYLEDFTGIHCGYCPEGHTIMAALEGQHGARFATVGIHAGGYAVPSAGEPDFRTPAGTAIDAYFTISGYPAGVVNRHIFNGLNDLGRGAWAGAVDEMLALPSPVNLGLESSFDPDTRLLTVNVEMYYTGDSPTGTDYLSVLIKENHIVGPQVDYGPSGNHSAYDHMHVFRGYLSATWGDAIGNPVAGTTELRTLTFTVPEAWNVDNCEVVALVSEDHSEVYQAREVPAVDGTTLLIASVENGDPMFVASSNGMPAPFTTILTNTIGQSELFNVELTRNTGPVSWSGSIAMNGVALANPGQISLGNAEPATIDVMITPDAAPGVANYVLTITSTTIPNAPAIVREFNVISGVTDLVVTHSGAEPWTALYIAGLEQAGNTSYANVPEDKFVDFGEADALGEVLNLYVNVSWTFPSLSDDEVAVLAAHLDNGGDMMIAGQDIGWDQSGVTGSYGTPATQAFYADRMHAVYVADGSSTSNLVNFFDEDPVFGEVPNSSVANVFAGNTYPDQITPTGNAVGILHYTTDVNKIGGLRSHDGATKVVYFGVGPEQMSNPSVGRAMIELSHDWFYGTVGVEDPFAALDELLGQAYPVPTSDRITIPLNDPELNTVLSVFDATGRLVMEERVSKGTSQVVLDVSELTVGVYRYSLRSSSGYTTAKAFQVVR
jgi:hypothetical protein